MTDIDVSYEGTDINIAGTNVSTDHPVQKIVVHRDRVIALLEPPPEIDTADNIIALDEDGEMLWRIESPSPEGDMPATFSDIRDVEGKLIAISWNGNSYDVDIETGEIDYRTWSK